MKKLNFIPLLLLFYFSLNAQSPDPKAPIWGVYASGVGEKLSTCMDPCWVTYTVAMTSDPYIIANIEYGTMAAVDQGITWFEATAQQRRFSRYFDDEADGTWKCTPCEINIANGHWNGWGKMTITGGGNSATGTYSDTYDKSKLGKIKLSKDLKGKWTGTWEEPAIGRKGILYDITISTNGKRISGKYDVTADGGKGNLLEGVNFDWTFSASTIKKNN